MVRDNVKGWAIEEARTWIVAALIVALWLWVTSEPTDPLDAPMPQMMEAEK